MILRRNEYRYSYLLNNIILLINTMTELLFYTSHLGPVSNH